MRGGPPGFDLGVDGAGHLVARQQVGGAAVVLRVVVPAVRLLGGLRVLTFEHRRDVGEHEPLAVGVLQHAAVAADTLGDEDALHARRPDHAGGVELDELHVDQCGPARSARACPSPVYSHELEVTFQDLPIPPVAMTTAGAVNCTNLPDSRQYPKAPAIRSAVAEEFGDGAFGEDLHPRLVVAGRREVLLLQRDDLLLHRADQFEARAVADVREPRIGVPAEVALADPAVRGAVEQRAVGLEFPHPVRRLAGVQFGHPPVVEELSAAHGVLEVDLPRVARVGVAHRGGAPALGHHGVRFAEQRLAHHRDPQSALPRLDDRPQPGSPRADHDHVVVVPLDFPHVCRLSVLRRARSIVPVEPVVSR